MSYFFRRPMPGVATYRYFVGDFDRSGRFKVSAVQTSCPDGEEIVPPAIVDLPDNSAQQQRLQEQRAACVPLKVCLTCRRPKPLANYTPQSRSMDGLSRRCIECNAAAQRAHRVITTTRKGKA